MDADKNFIVGIFDDEDAVISGVTTVRKSGVMGLMKFWATKEVAFRLQRSCLE